MGCLVLHFLVRFEYCLSILSYNQNQAQLISVYQLVKQFTIVLTHCISFDEVTRGNNSYSSQPLCMPYRRISRDLKLAAMHLYERDLMELPDLLGCQKVLCLWTLHHHWCCREPYVWTPWLSSTPSNQPFYCCQLQYNSLWICLGSCVYKETQKDCIGAEWESLCRFCSLKFCVPTRAAWIPWWDV